MMLSVKGFEELGSVLFQWDDHWSFNNHAMVDWKCMQHETHKCILYTGGRQKHLGNPTEA